MKRNPGMFRTKAIPLALAESNLGHAPWLISGLTALAVLLIAVALISLTSCGGGSALPAAGGDPPATDMSGAGDPTDGGADNTGAGTDPAGDTGDALPRATAADFTLDVQQDTYQVLDSVDDIIMTVEDLGDTVAVRATIFGAVEMYAFVATLDFDPQRFNPISLKLADMEQPQLGLQEPNKLPGAKEYGRYWLIENRT